MNDRRNVKLLTGLILDCSSAAMITTLNFVLGDYAYTSASFDDGNLAILLLPIAASAIRRVA